MPATYTSRLEGTTTSVAVKAPCRLKTTANRALAGLPAVDGVVPEEYDRILVADQDDLTENGIWLASSAAWSRALDFNGTYDAVGGSQMLVIAGASQINTYWRVDADGPVVIGTDDIEFVQAAVTDSATMAYVPQGVGAYSRTVQDKLREWVSVLDYIPPAQHAAIFAGTSTYDASADIQAAIDTDAPSILFPRGVYKAHGLLLNNDYQELLGFGAQIVKNGDGAIFTISKRGVDLMSLRLSGASATYTGDNIVMSGANDCTLDNCESVDARDCALIATDVNNLRVVVGIYNTATGAGYDIKIIGTGPVTALYNKIQNIGTNQSAGGILIDQAGATSVEGCQFGKLTTQAAT